MKFFCFIFWWPKAVCWSLKCSGYGSTNKNDRRTNVNIRKPATGQGDDYTTDCLLDCPCFKENYKLIAIDLSKCNTDPKAIQQINFIRNLECAGNSTSSSLSMEFKKLSWISYKEI